MKRHLHGLAVAALLLGSALAPAQAQICPTAPAGTNNNQCASTAFVATAVASVSGITALTGDGTATGPGSVALTLATVNSNVGSFGSSTAIPSFTVNGKGLITAASSNAVIAPASTLTGTTLASNVLASSLTSVGTLTGGATGAGFTLNFGSSTLTGRVPFANVPQGAAYTFAGNPTGSTADLQAFTIPSLTNKASPTGSDLLILADAAASNATKYCTLTQCLGAITAGVSSIAGNTGAFTLANGIDNSTNQIQLTAARRTLPTFQALISGSGATYTTPANALWIEVFACGGGASGGGTTDTGAGAFVAGNAGGTTTFNSINAAGGSPPSTDSGGGAGGTGGTGTATRRAPGSPGAGTLAGNTVLGPSGGNGGNSFCGGGAKGPPGGAFANGNAAAANSGAGGSGAVGGGTNFISGPGGGGGEFFYLLINSPAGTYTYTIGAGGAGTGAGHTSGNGGTGFIFVIEHYGS